jgi:cellulose biosynthesis protein BcsQ
MTLLEPNQPILAIISNAGGSGKTTLATHLAYEIASRKIQRRPCSVALLDLDPQGSLSLFCGLEKPTEPDRSVAAALSDKFSGQWSLTPCWTKHGLKVDVCQSIQQPLLEVADDLVTHPRGPYILSDHLKDYALPHDLVIIDCPATLGRLNLVALAASTHILIPIQLEPKSASGAAELLEFYFIEDIEWCGIPKQGSNSGVTMVQINSCREDMFHRSSRKLTNNASEKGIGAVGPILISIKAEDVVTIHNKGQGNNAVIVVIAEVTEAGADHVLSI